MIQNRTITVNSGHPARSKWWSSGAILEEVRQVHAVRRTGHDDEHPLHEQRTEAQCRLANERQPGRRVKDVLCDEGERDGHDELPDDLRRLVEPQAALVPDLEVVV